MEVSGLLLQQRPWVELRAAAERWDASGARALYVADHLRPSPQFIGGTWLDAFTLLGALAASTTRIRLGTLVSSWALREPRHLQLAASSLAEISGGRFELGLGAGGRPSDEPDRDPVARPPWELVVRFEEAAAAVHGLVPLHLAAHGPRSLAVVERYGDAWSFAGHRRSDAAGQLAFAAELAAQLSKPMRRSVLVGVNPGLTYTSLDELHAMAAAYAAIGFTELVVYDPPWALDDGPSAPPSVIDELFANLERFAVL